MASSSLCITISTYQTSLKSSLSSDNRSCSFIDRSNNGVAIRKSKCYGSDRIEGLRHCNGKSRPSSVICSSVFTSDISSTASTVSAAYGALLLGGGLFAYTRTGSKGSLFGGLAGGVIMSGAFFLMQTSETKDVGDALAFGSAFLFAFVFGIRLASTRKIVPAAPLLGVSLAALVVFFSAYMQDRLQM